MLIKILGPGCPKCHELDKRANAVIREMGVDARIEQVKDINTITKYAVLITPGLVINEELVFSGRVPTKKEIAQLVNNALEKGQKI